MVALALVQVAIEVFGVAVARIAVPQSIEEWFALVQSNRILALTELTSLQIPLFCLFGLVLLGVHRALRPAAPAYVDAATLIGLIGIPVYVTSNTALTILSLSDQYLAASTAMERTALLAAGNMALAQYDGMGLNVGVPLVMASCFVLSALMWRSPAFGSLPAAVGLAAALGTLAYYVALPLGPPRIFILEAAGGVFVMWIGLVGWRLFRLSARVTVGRVVSAQLPRPGVCA